MSGQNEGSYVVVGFDGSKGSAMRLAGRSAKQRFEKPRCKRCTCGIPPSSPGEVLPGRRRSATTCTRRSPWPWTRRWRMTLVEAIRWSNFVEEGHPVPSLCGTANGPDVDLVVVGSRGHGGVTVLLLGSVSQAVAVDCPKPLAIIPTDMGDWDPDGPIVVGVDGSAQAGVALRWAAEEARLHDRTLRVVMAWSAQAALVPRVISPARSPSELEQRTATALDDAVHRVLTSSEEPVPPVEQIARVGGAAVVLLGEARKASMLVVGRRGLGAVRATTPGARPATPSPTEARFPS